MLTDVIGFAFKILVLLVIVWLVLLMLRLLLRPFTNAALNFGWSSVFSCMTVGALLGTTWGAIKFAVIRDLGWGVVKAAAKAVGALF